MGIKSLNTLISKYSNYEERKSLSNYSGLTFAIDTNLYIYKYLYGKNNHIDGIFFMINKLKKFNINSIFVFDGKPPEEKKDKIESRRFVRNKLELRVNSLKSDLEDNFNINIKNEINNLEKRIMHVTYEVINKTKNLFDYMGIAYIDADCEAEHYCSKLCKLNLVDGVISEDTDTIVCGSKIVIREFSNRDDTVICYNINDILYDLNLNQDSFVDLCILLGNDYNNRIKGFSPDKIFELISEYKTIENLLDNNIIKFINFNYNTIRNIFKLKNIKPNIELIKSQLNKKFQLDETINFLKQNSSIDEKTFRHRLNLIYKINFKNNTKKTLFINSRIKSKEKNLYQIEFDQYSKLYNNL